MAEDAPLAWRRERAQLLATIERQQQDAARLTKRFRLLQRTLVDQQTLLDRYQRALQQAGALPPSASTEAVSSVTIAPAGATPAERTADDGNGDDSAMSVAVTDSNSSKAITVDVRPKAAAAKSAEASGTTPAHRPATPQPPRQVTQDSEDLAQSSRSQKRRAHALRGIHSNSSTSNESLTCERASGNALGKTPHDPEPTQPHHHRAIAETKQPRASVRDDVTRVSSASTSPAKDVRTDAAAAAVVPVITAAHSPQKDPDPVVEPSKPQSAAPGSGSTSSSWITRKSDFYRTSTAAAEASGPEQPQDHESSDNDSDTVDGKPLKPDTSTRATGPIASVTTATAAAATSALHIVSKKRRAPSTDCAPTWAEEKRRMQDAGLLKTWRRPLPDAKPPLRPDSRTATATSDDTHAFKYVEVVRNRDVRAALPAHDCVECRKYYAALDGVLPDDDIARAKATCSRHRARFEPYNTPDDFWRLSFPDSQDQASSP